jgi:putative salt-induced outer membrane protein
MKKTLIAGLVLAALASAVHAQDANTASGSTDNSSNAANNGGWSGSGEFGYAAARGNSRTDNANAKLTLNQENELWKNNFFLNGLRSKGEVQVQDEQGNTINRFSTTANRYETGASVGYKLDTRSYIVGAARYDHDDFGANLWQGTVSIGYGYIALKNEQAELSFEIGPGYKRYRPADQTITEPDGTIVKTRQDTESEPVARGLVNFKYRLTGNTALEDTFLLEAGSKNKYYQNDIGLSVSMTKKLAIKLGYQVRFNSDVQVGIKHTDTLATTNMVYNF